jgi:hypothetical protein
MTGTPSGRALCLAAGWALALLLVASGAEAQEAARELVFEPHLTAWLRGELAAPGDFNVTVPLLRPWFALGLPDGRTHFNFKADLGGGNVRLLDANVEYVVSPAFAVQAGRFKTPFSRLWMTPTRKLELPDRGPTVDFFELGRGAGVMLSGQPARAFTYDAGVVAVDRTPVAVARVAFTAYGSVPASQTASLEEAHPSGLSFGLGGYFTAGSLVTDADEAQEDIEQHLTGGADLELVEGPFTLLAEGFMRGNVGREIPHGLSYGVVAQASAFIVPRRLEVVGRGNWLDPDVTIAGDFEQTYEAGLTGYLVDEPPFYGHHLKLEVRYRYDVATVAHRLSAQLQLFL